VEQVSEILAANEDAYGHVRFAVARDNVTVTVPAAGWIIGVTHGHIARSGANAESEVAVVVGEAGGGETGRIGDSDVLVSGHYHHLRVADWGGCVWLQAPAIDGGSDYWRVATGEVSQPGMLTFVTTVDQRVADISVL
jgi:hypothetical protein